MKNEKSIKKIIEDELEWSARNNKTFRFHTVETAINKLFKTCDVKDCENEAVGYFIVGQEARVWLCLEHEL